MGACRQAHAPSPSTAASDAAPADWRQVQSEQQATLQAVTAQLQAAQEHNASLQEEVDRLSSEVRETGQASELQRQFREVTNCINSCTGAVLADVDGIASSPLAWCAGNRATVPEADAARAPGSREGCAAADTGAGDRGRPAAGGASQ